jgi:hypothetical protein
MAGSVTFEQDMLARSAEELAALVRHPCDRLNLIYRMSQYPSLARLRDSVQRIFKADLA